MLKKSEYIESIVFNEKFADCWTIVIDYDGYDYETLTCSDNPSHPQGVFSSNEGRCFDENSEEHLIKEWEDLPETLQKFLIDYINISMGDPKPEQEN